MKTLLRIKVILRIWAGVCLFIVCPPSAGSVLVFSISFLMGAEKFGCL